MLENSNFPLGILTRLLHDFTFYIAEERTPDETEGDKKDVGAPQCVCLTGSRVASIL